MLIRWWVKKKKARHQNFFLLFIRFVAAWLHLDNYASIYAKWGLFDEVLTDQIQDNLPQEPPRSFCCSVFTTNALVKHAISQPLKCLVMRMMTHIYLLKLIKLPLYWLRLAGISEPVCHCCLSECVVLSLSLCFHLWKKHQGWCSNLNAHWDDRETRHNQILMKSP